MEEKNNILYVGNKPGTNDVDCYHKKDITSWQIAKCHSTSSL